MKRFLNRWRRGVNVVTVRLYRRWHLEIFRASQAGPVGYVGHHIDGSVRMIGGCALWVGVNVADWGGKSAVVWGTRDD